MKQKIPKELLGSKYRQEMWKNSMEILRKLEKVMPVSSVYLLGGLHNRKKKAAGYRCHNSAEDKAEKEKRKVVRGLSGCP
ncbi:MAG: hypothetical protein HYX24_02120 [Candidatus Aenigmarchaeota archaeon]|nr:hypothetical protein [Candidatus Aenigmarchaeota archaeon]